MTTSKVFISILLFVPLLVFTQTGPGGVGTTDGSSSLEFWYMAEEENYTNGDLVDTIFDRSGNGRTATALGGERPTFTATTAGANNLASLSFNLNDELEAAYVGNSNETMTLGMVMNYNTDGGLNVALQHGGRNTIGVSSTGFYTDFVGGSNHTSSTSATSNWFYHAKTFDGAGPSGLDYFANNTNTDNFTYTIENRSSNTWIGGHGSGGGTGWNGGIAEAFKFSRILNSAEQTIIANYLSAKYDIGLTNNDIYVQDDGANGDYDIDVAGIGRIDASNLHDDSQGTGILRILNPSGLGNNEFLIWGRDNNSLNATETIDVPTGVDARFASVWRASEVNTSGGSIDVGNIDLRFDLSGLGSITLSDLRLLVDTDNDGVFTDETIGTGGIISGATALGGDVYAFTGVAAIEDGLRFTLATANATQTPLPIELLDFSAASLNNQYVKLTWQTAAEINNAFFTIERSNNGLDWKATQTIDGAGNTSTIRNYDAIDREPYSGLSYYRLKQTDFNGQYSYSNLVQVRIKLDETSELKVYPNPTADQITILGKNLRKEELRIYNVFGQDVTSLSLQIGADQSRLVLDLSALSKGMYFLKTKATDNPIRLLVQ